MSGESWLLDFVQFSEIRIDSVLGWFWMRTSLERVQICGLWFQGLIFLFPLWWGSMWNLPHMSNVKSDPSNVYLQMIIHPASRGVAAHTAGLFRSVRGAKGGFPPWGLFKLRSFNKKSFQNIVFDSVFPMFPVKQTVIYTFFAIKAVNPSKTLLLTVFL